MDGNPKPPLDSCSKCGFKLGGNSVGHLCQSCYQGEAKRMMGVDVGAASGDREGKRCAIAHPPCERCGSEYCLCACYPNPGPMPRLMFRPESVGWLCPRCGRGNGPLCMYCPCKEIDDSAIKRQLGVGACPPTDRFVEKRSLP